MKVFNRVFAFVAGMVMAIAGTSCDRIAELISSEETVSPDSVAAGSDYSIYLSASRRLASHGDYEKAEIAYNIYKDLAHKRDSELELILSSHEKNTKAKPDSETKTVSEPARPYGPFTTRDEVVDFVNSYYKAVDKGDLHRFFPEAVDRFYDRHGMSRAEVLKEEYVAANSSDYYVDATSIDARPMQSGDLRIVFKMNEYVNSPTGREHYDETVEMIVNSSRQIRSIYLTSKTKQEQ